MRKIKKILSYFWYYLWGNILFIFLYDKKYYRSKHFKSRYFNITAQGWRWVLNDFRSRLFLGVNRGVPFPISPFNTIGKTSNLIFDVDDLHNFQGKGKYFQTYKEGKIYIGENSYIASNVGLITANHDIKNLEEHAESKDIIIGENSWIGMNSVVLPGIVLGDNTIVGAGSIVTKSFSKGNVIIAGNPAKIIRYL